MSNEVVPIGELDNLSAKLAVSGIFAGKSKEQIFALLMLANAEGVHPMTAMRDFDIIQGRPAKKAEAMHRSFLAAGGSVTWNKLDDTIADGTFKHPQGGEARIVWDMERVKKAEIKNEAMYKKFPRAMLRSRCVSEGVRTVCPGATSGLYEPGEIAGFSGEKDMGKAEIVEEGITVKHVEDALKESGIEKSVFLAKTNGAEIADLDQDNRAKAIAWLKKNKVA